MYLEFISDVTEDILSRRHISERFVIFSSCALFFFLFNKLLKTSDCCVCFLCKGPGPGDRAPC